MLHDTPQTRATHAAPEARGLAVSTFAACFFFAQALGAWAGGLVLDGFGATALVAAGPCMLLLGLRLAPTLGRGQEPGAAAGRQHP